MNIISFEKKVKKNYLWLVLIVSILIHISEATLTAISYAQMEINNDPSTLKWIIAWVSSFIAFFGIAAISFSSAIMIPTTFKNIGDVIKEKKNPVFAIFIFTVYLGLYLFMQYIFIMANLTLGNLIKTVEAIIIPITISLNMIEKDAIATVFQAKATGIALLIIYANIGFEIVLAISFLHLETITENNPNPTTRATTRTNIQSPTSSGNTIPVNTPANTGNSTVPVTVTNNSTNNVSPN